MLAKITSKNQITIPKKIMDKLPETKHFDVELQEGVILLRPVRIYDTDLERIRLKMKSLGLKQDTVAEAIKWARKE
jgi:bifunctional DNA-binding transcriptional regulator/antitoxin component of YhaV-PrlF toxin-antitoxin module